MLVVAANGAAYSRSLLMISVDGMKPEYVTQADEHGLKVPFLRSILRRGVHAQGVEGVWPTNTYPSHTTLLTGQWPAAHGIYTNLEFDPGHTYADAWFWYAAQIRVPTLWQAAHRAGLATASIGWPVSVGADAVDTLIPEYWRQFRPTAELNPSDRELIAALARPVDLLDRMQKSLGPYLMGNDTSTAADAIKTRFAIDILQRQKPAFMTLHLSSLDDVEHDHGPFSPQANRQMEVLDEMLSRLDAAARAVDPDAVTMIVSDHGFTTLKYHVNLYVPFVQAGLLQRPVEAPTATPGGPTWQAQPWLASGMAAIMLNPAAPAATKDTVRALLDRLAADPGNGIAEVLDQAAVAARGGFPDAAFLLVMKPGYATGTAWSGPLVTDIPGTRGGHGFAPSFPEMRSAFFAVGGGLAHRDLGVVDMRQIAPTVAELLGISFPTAQAGPLHVRE